MTAPPVSRIAVVLHLFYVDLWPEFAQALDRIPESFDLFVTTPTERLHEAQRLVLQDHPHATVLAVPNRGRDVGALLALMERVPLEHYPLVLKLHSKKSPHMAQDRGALWRKRLLSGLVPQGRVHRILDQFAQQPTLGLLGPHSQAMDLVPSFYHPETVRHWNDLMARLGEPDLGTKPRFIAGTMFWVRGSVLKVLRQLHIQPNDFEPEAGQKEGTLAHALERLFLPLTVKAGLKLDSADHEDLQPWLAKRTLWPQEQMRIEKRVLQARPKQQLLLMVRHNDATAQPVWTEQSMWVGEGIQALPIELSHWHASSGLSWAQWLGQQIQETPCEWVMVIESHEQIRVQSLWLALDHAQGQKAFAAWYADRLIQTGAGSVEAAFFADFDATLLIGFPWLMGRHWLLSTSVLRTLGGVRTDRADAAELDLVLRLVRAGHRVGHVHEPLIQVPEPRALAPSSEEQQTVIDHVQALGYAQPRLLDLGHRKYRVDYNHARSARVSVVVACQDNVEAMQQMVESLLENPPQSGLSLCVIDRGSRLPAMQQWLQGLSQIAPDMIQVHQTPRDWSWPQALNWGARLAQGEVLAFVHAHMVFVQKDWAVRLINQVLRDEVAIVCPRVIDRQGLVLEAGRVLGLGIGAGAAHAGQSLESQGYLNLLLLDHQCDTASARCALIRRERFEALGGFDVQLDEGADWDLGLRARQAGWVNVVVPHAWVLDGQGEDPSQGLGLQTERAENETSAQAFRRRWWLDMPAHTLSNKNFSWTGTSHAVEPEVDMAWRPLSGAAQHQRSLVWPSDPFGCGQYRLIQPALAMREHGLAEIALVCPSRELSVSDVAIQAPSVMLVQRVTQAQPWATVQAVARELRLPLVQELDDLLTHVTAGNPYRKFVNPQFLKIHRESIAMCDRLVVSTPALAHAYRGWNPDIRVRPLQLPPAWWRFEPRVRSVARQRPRVGWAGGSSHLADLLLLRDVVRELHQEVHWVFFGMCPEPLRPYVHEFHSGVAIEDYPSLLAGLDLDLALAPLEDNRFNDCKSDLRLLEYGACGFPVVCSDVRPYRESGLPVTLVKNKYKAWIEAIRSHLSDLDASWEMGQQLRQAVRQERMLDAASLKDWLKIWTP